MKVFEAISEATHLLQAYTPQPREEAQRLLSWILGSDRSTLIAHYQDNLEESTRCSFLASVQDRCQGKPLQFITGIQEFCGLEFEVTPDVLIPRPETELVVEETLHHILSKEPTLVDLGTGSGCISIALAVQLPGAKIFAIDLSGPALAIAKKNAARHRVIERIQFLQGDLFSPLDPLELRASIDCIVSNPPYVSEEDFLKLQREVREWEPKLALVAGNDGLSLYRRMIPKAKSLLRVRGHLVTEIGFNMLDLVCGLFDSSWQIQKVRGDHNEIPRVVVAERL